MRSVIGWMMRAVLLSALLSAGVAAEISFRDTIALGTAKLYQTGSQGYSLELVFADTASGQARFLVNQKELTEPFDDQYTTQDNSTIQILEIESDNAGGTPMLTIYFSGTQIDPLRFDDGRGYRASRVMSAFDYTQIYTQEEIEARGLPKQRTDAAYTTMDAGDAAARPAPTQSQTRKIDLEARRSTFDFGWLRDFWTWIKGIFT